MASHLATSYTRSIEIVSGDGCFLTDANGKRYLDFIAGWCVGNIGWGHPEVVRAIQEHAGRGVYVPPFLRYKGWNEFADLLVSHAPGSRLSRVYRATSGSEAVEFAIKCARAATGKRVIVSVDGVYHGHTYAAASVGDACSKSMEPCVPGFLKIPMPDSRAGVSSADAIRAFETILSENKDVAAFLSEPVWTNAGAIIPPADFYPAIQALCRERGVLFIMDEVATGFGRTGRLFGSELWGLEPDMLCLGKALTGGYGTMGATLVSENVFRRSRRIPDYSTFGWNPFDLVAARANVEILLREKLWENAETVGTKLLQMLKPLEAYGSVGEVRGIGLTIGVEIGKRRPNNRAQKMIHFLQTQFFQNRLTRRGLLLETAGNALFIAPPLVLTLAEAEQGARTIREAFGLPLLEQEGMKGS